MKALNNISFKVMPGEIFGLVGRNGSGKTTILKTITGMIKPDDGHIMINDQAVDVGMKEYKSIIGYCPQNDSFFEKLTVEENLGYFARLYNVEGDLENIIKGVTNSLGIGDRIYEIAEKLSGGMKRRLNIACSLLHDPGFLLLDEPSIQLDPISRNELWNTIKMINKTGTTIIISSNMMEEINSLCNRVIFMDQGNKIYEGDPRGAMNYLSGHRKNYYGDLR
ncbi:MAG: ABC transporter ATP-binding protein [Candidatus Peribacteraceae bacterium]|nr:ABC transporter ATP-binding protein [Candidatus Peribacteraceae bacterium]